MTSAEPVEVDPSLLRAWPLPPPGSDKQARGTVMVVGGTTRTPGAVLLAGEAALRVGAGRLQITTVRPVAAALGVALPEAMVYEASATTDGEIAPAEAAGICERANDCDVALVGPGCWDEPTCVALTTDLVAGLRTRLVLDAVATASVRDRPGQLLTHVECVVTANPRELATALGEDELAEDDLHSAACALADREGAVVLCGGPSKVVASPAGRSWLVRAGGPGLGVSGSGDVQAGLVAGLLARGAEPVQAAVWAAYLHGRSGDLLATKVGLVGFLAREVSAQATAVLADLSR
ncbi:MAG TPA: NAD(P)H-hydrate dehydratase [Dermatophilaceae bacterium]|nr:NAD(P)H-hydrate dehydratase [Dermatophilaceae bacterium]